MSPSPKFRSGAKVFAKLRGYPPWPARIEGCTGEATNKARFHVYFYGTGQTAVVKRQNVFDFVENKHKMGKVKRNKNFKKAMDQIVSELTPERGTGTEETASPAMTASKETPKDEVPEASDEASSEPDTPTVGWNGPSWYKTVKPSLAIYERNLYNNPMWMRTELDSSAYDPSPEKTSTTASKTPAAPSTNLDKDKDKNLEGNSRYLLATRGNTKIRIHLNLNRPSFDDNVRRNMTPIEWDDLIFNEARSLKKKIESGATPITEEEVKDHMERFSKEMASTVYVMGTPDEDVQFNEYIEAERELLYCALQIKLALTMRGADTALCLRVLEKLKTARVSALMLKKHPEIFNIVKRLRMYVGFPENWGMSEQEIRAFERAAWQIRDKAAEVVIRFKTLFPHNTALSFWRHFSNEVAYFKYKTRHMTAEEVCAITTELE